jgi:succinylglutamate desuccinylase
MDIFKSSLCTYIRFFVSADQVDNAAMVEELGVAKRIQKTQLSDSDEILKALRSVVASHSVYRQRAKEVSSMWRHWQGLVSPQENFAFWIETLLRHGGDLSLLKIEDNDLQLWQYFSLDVILFIGCLLVFKVAAMSWLLKKIWYLSIKNATMSDGGIKKFKAQ